MVQRKKSRLKTLLINPYSRDEMPAYYFPIGLGYIAAVLKKKDYPVEVLDNDAFRYSDEEVKEKLSSVDFDVVGIGGIITSYKYVKWLVKIIKEIKPDSKVIIGGHLGASVPELLFKNSDVDIIVFDDGEETVPELYSNINNPKKVKGIWYKSKGKIIKNPARPPVKDLNSIPFPAYDLFPIEKYIRTSITNMESKSNSRSISIITHRGCPFRCIFCHNPNQKMRARSTDNVMEELRFLKKKYKITFVHFADELFVLNKKWVFDICRKMKKERIGIKWACFGRVNLVDKELLKEMKSAGCTYVGYGIESASQKMLNAMKKDCTTEQQRNALRITKKLGIETYPTFIIGTPGETEETVQESVDFCKQFNLIPEFFFMTPFPNTELYDYALKKNLIKDEDKYVDSLGECYTFRINLTSMSDEKLKSLKRKAERELQIHFAIKHPLLTIGKIYKVYRNYGFSKIALIIGKRFSNIAHRKNGKLC
ncbi:B12-binding domain-containing radical SAM protein [candidate division KSB1 bacterium]